MKRKKKGNEPPRSRDIPESARRLRELQERGLAELRACEEQRAANG